jgi:hypothetical protein
MIIVLKNANFSASNIGTLSTWIITRSIGAGATYEGPTSVDKGAAFSATVTLAEGYEVGTAGVTITMGGTVLSGAHSISGNVITITIASVTGNVLIKVPTVNTSTGEEEEPEVPDTPDEPGTGGGTSDSISYVNNAYISADGSFKEISSAWCRTDYIPVTLGQTIRYTGTVMTALPCVYAYDSNKTPIKILLNNGTYADGINITIDSDDIAYVACASYIDPSAVFSVKFV